MTTDVITDQAVAPPSSSARDEGENTGTGSIDAAGDALKGTASQLEDMLCNVIGLDSIGRDENFWDAGLDSMQAVSLIMLIQKKFAVKLTVAALLENSTALKLARAINEPQTPDRSGLVPLLAVQSALSPLFFMHMSGGDLTRYAKLTATMGTARSIFGLIPPKISPQPATLEELAKCHVASIRTVQPRGPYHLVGYCFGGLLSYEVAQQLTAAGESVALLGIIDFPFNIAGHPIRFRWSPASIWKFIRNLGNWARDIAALESADRSKIFAAKFKWAGMRLRHSFDASAPLPGEPVEPCPEGVSPETWNLHEQAWRNYKPKPYSGKVTLLRLRSLPILQPYDETFGWEALAPKTRVEKIPGPLHGDVLRPPYVQKFADLLNRLLSAVN